MYQQYQPGWLEVITGPMFAGKSEELIRRIRTLSYAKKSIVCFKPAIDDRYAKEEIASHAGNMWEAKAVKDVSEIKEFLKDKKYDIVGIDEVQFFSSEIIQLIDELINQDTRVIVAGLDLDFRGEPFGVMPTLLAKAEFVTKLTAACKICGEAATRTQRIINGKPALYDSPIILVGAKDSYEARCHKHHIVPKK